MSDNRGGFKKKRVIDNLNLNPSSNLEIIFPVIPEVSINSEVRDDDLGTSVRVELYENSEVREDDLGARVRVDLYKNLENSGTSSSTSTSGSDSEASHEKSPEVEKEIRKKRYLNFNSFIKML